jgi:hypothetical protein
MTNEEKLEFVLRIFRQMDTPPGDGLPPNVIAGAAARAGRRLLDLKGGLELGARRRWFEVRPDGFVTLTAQGHDQV